MRNTSSLALSPATALTGFSIDHNNVWQIIHSRLISQLSRAEEPAISFNARGLVAGAELGARAGAGARRASNLTCRLCHFGPSTFPRCLPGAHGPGSCGRSLGGSPGHDCKVQCSHPPPSTPPVCTVLRTCQPPGPGPSRAKLPSLAPDI